MKKVAVILSGCGVFDGAEIHESVFTMLSLSRRGASYQCFAPDIAQLHVINHLTGEVEPNQQRNVLQESARIARGEIKALQTLQVQDFDALVVPGGFGAAKNLCDFALKGRDCQLHPQVLKVCQDFARQGKAAGYACIAPAMLPVIYGNGIKLTIGNDEDTAAAIRSMGGEHQSCAVDEVVVDEKARVVSTPAYMLADSINQAADSIDKMIEQLLLMA